MFVGSPHSVTLWWTLRYMLRLKPLPHYSDLNGLPVVWTLMSTKVCVETEAFITLPSCGLSGEYEIWGASTEIFTMLFTFIGLLSHMNSLMNVEFRTPTKVLSTSPALVRSLSCVLFLMDTQIWAYTDMSLQGSSYHTVDIYMVSVLHGLSGEWGVLNLQWSLCHTHHTIWPLSCVPRSELVVKSSPHSLHL